MLVITSFCGGCLGLVHNLGGLFPGACYPYFWNSSSTDLVALIRTDPPDLESALRVIKASREAELSGQPQSVLSDNESGAGAALKHLMLYVNAVKLYEVSLGMYDLEMAYMVVTNAQVRTESCVLRLNSSSAIVESNTNLLIPQKC